MMGDGGGGRELYVMYTNSGQKDRCRVVRHNNNDNHASSRGQRVFTSECQGVGEAGYCVRSPPDVIENVSGTRTVSYA